MDGVMGYQYGMLMPGSPIVKLKIMLMETELVFRVIQRAGLEKMK